MAAVAANACRVQIAPIKCPARNADHQAAALYLQTALPMHASGIVTLVAQWLHAQRGIIVSILSAVVEEVHSWRASSALHECALLAAVSKLCSRTDCRSIKTIRQCTE